MSSSTALVSVAATISSRARFPDTKQSITDRDAVNETDQLARVEPTLPLWRLVSQILMVVSV